MVWRSEQIGDREGLYPNGGIWRYVCQDPTLRVFLKRIGPQFLGGDPVWGGRLEAADPHWWRREAEFYGSDLAVRGWAATAGPAACYGIVDGPAGSIDLWLDDLDIPTLTLDSYRDVVRSLAVWQLAHRDTEAAFLSSDWIPTHVERRRLDNNATLAHPNWQLAIDRGLNPRVREVVETRVTDAATATRLLARHPRVLTHYDLHHGNIGWTRDEHRPAIIDWAFVGWGPVGQDVGHLALDTWDKLQPAHTVREVWDALTETYVSTFQANEAPWTPDDIRASIRAAIAVRYGWSIDELLTAAPHLTDPEWTAAIHTVEHVADLLADTFTGNATC